jgi:signal transduction histidine kinase
MDNDKVPSLEERLAAAEEALRLSEQRSTAGQLALELMHEIMNPLEALGHLVYLAREQADDPEQVRQYMHWAEEQMVQLVGIATQTLESARPSPSLRMIDLSGLAEAALRIHHRRINDQNIRVTKKISADINAEVRRGEMLQVLSNLIANALDALPPQGTLFIRLRKDTRKVRFVIADTGRGIPAEHLDAIFAPFFTTKAERGTGLGLALAKKIVERHGGTIRVRSSTRNSRSGTAFRISLPIKP